MRVEEFDAVVVGGGLSGLRAALELSSQWNVALVSKMFCVRSHSGAAQGGINAALGNVEEGKDDTPERHAFDTVKGSDYLADQDIVQYMCEEAPKIVMEYESMGTPFSRLPSGLIAQRPFGGGGFPRTCYAGDRTGHALLHTLFEQCVHTSVKLFEEYFLIDIIKVGDQVSGILTLDIAAGEFVVFRTPNIIMATGGFGRIYKKSTNGVMNTGDGVGAAFRAGVPMEDVEFVQFHPTTLFGSNILITEGARGEGAYLFNNKGERFMAKYSPQMQELAPRDIVARSIETEILEGRGFEGGYVQLSLTHLDPEAIKEKLPGILEICQYFGGIDATTEPIPIQPGQHYMMGGIATVYDGWFGQTPLSGLYAIGECACLSVHGANRLGGNSVLETAVFGRYIGRKLLERGLIQGVESDAAEQAENQIIADTEALLKAWETNNGKKPAVIRDAMGELMDKEVGIFRDQKHLNHAVVEVGKLQKEFLHVHVPTSDRKYNYSLLRTLELRNMLDIAECTAFAAAWRHESRGGHSRTDYPKRDDENFLCHSLVTRTEDGLVLETQPVRTGIFEIKERAY